MGRPMEAPLTSPTWLACPTWLSWHPAMKPSSSTWLPRQQPSMTDHPVSGQRCPSASVVSHLICVRISNLAVVVCYQSSAISHLLSVILHQPACIGHLVSMSDLWWCASACMNNQSALMCVMMTHTLCAGPSMLAPLKCLQGNFVLVVDKNVVRFVPSWFICRLLTCFAGSDACQVMVCHVCLHIYLCDNLHSWSNDTTA